MSILGALRGTGIPSSLKIIRGWGAMLLILAPLRVLILPSDAAERVSRTRPSTPLSGRLTKPVAPPPEAIAQFRARCSECHDVDGRGECARDVMRTIPDFTNPSWQASRSDQQLAHSISEGKGKSMPAMKRKLAPAEIGQLIVLVRRFSGGQFVVPDEESEDPNSQPDPPAVVPAARAMPRPTPNPSPNLNPIPDSGAVAGLDAGPIFQRSCRICHGADGRGSPTGNRLPGIPDFTSGPWQAGRSRAQLMASILEGKGGMPSFRDKLGGEEIRALVSYIRGFGPVRDQPQEAPLGEFDRSLGRLQQEFEALHRAYRELSPRPPNP